MTTAALLNLVGLLFGLSGTGFLVFSPDPVLNVLVKAASPTVISIGQGPDMQAISQLGMDVTKGARQWRNRVRIGCYGLLAGFAFQTVALFF